MPPSLHVLYEQISRPGPREITSELLARFYGGRLALPEATPAPVIANFVTTIDGVATFDRGSARGAAAVSAGSASDRLLMAMLRAAADVILIGAGTLRVTTNHRWTAEALVPELRDELDEVRTRLTGSADHPRLVVVSATGELPTGHPALGPEVDAMVVTTAKGAQRLGRPASPLRVLVASESGAISATALMAAVQSEMSPRLVLTEGGPLLMGGLFSANLVDELFQTVTPVIAGRRAAASRPGMVDGFEAPPDSAPRARLLSLRRDSEGALFFRHGFGAPQPARGAPGVL